MFMQYLLFNFKKKDLIFSLTLCRVIFLQLPKVSVQKLNININRFVFQINKLAQSRLTIKSRKSYDKLVVIVSLGRT